MSIHPSPLEFLPTARPSRERIANDNTPALPDATPLFIFAVAGMGWVVAVATIVWWW